MTTLSQNATTLDPTLASIAETMLKLDVASHTIEMDELGRYQLAMKQLTSAMNNIRSIQKDRENPQEIPLIQLGQGR